VKSAFPDSHVAYFDSSAIVKLFRQEPQSAALREFLGGRARLATSELAVVEATRVARRFGGPEATRVLAVLSGLALRGLTRRVLARAAQLDPPSLRSLDAIHLATFLELAPLPAFLITYDAAMAEAARMAGVRVVAPA